MGVKICKSSKIIRVFKAVKKPTQNQNIKVEFDVSHITIDENDQTEHEKFLKLLSKKSKQEINW